ncbi:MAG: GNAT family N-acetyltransferase [Acidobacteria bacterium]|nr:GNAT family N-acetyltransferase [Acidobacteriota bacterium]
MNCEIRPAHSGDMEQVRALFREYQQSLGIDLCFQSFEEELASLPGRYGPPGGLILLAEQKGVVALRPLDPATAEMKRLYVRPSAQGTGLGRALAEAAISEARRKGYRRLRLDTLPQMGKAIKLYQKLGFQEIEPYTENPIHGALFLEIDLREPDFDPQRAC